MDYVEKEILVFGFNKIKEELVQKTKELETVKQENELLKVELAKFKQNEKIDNDLDILFRETEKDIQRSSNVSPVMRTVVNDESKGKYINYFVSYTRDNNIIFRPRDMKYSSSSGNIISRYGRHYLTIETYARLNDESVRQLEILEDIFRHRGYRTSLDKRYNINAKDLKEYELRSLRRIMNENTTYSFAHLIVEDVHPLESFKDIKINIDDYVELKELYRYDNKKRRISEVLNTELEELSKRHDHTNEKNVTQ